MICPKCSSENRPGAKYCDECGASLFDAADTCVPFDQAVFEEAAAQTVVLPAIEPTCASEQERLKEPTADNPDGID